MNKISQAIMALAVSVVGLASMPANARVNVDINVGLPPVRHVEVVHLPPPPPPVIVTREYREPRVVYVEPRRVEPVVYEEEGYRHYHGHPRRHEHRHRHWD